MFGVYFRLGIEHIADLAGYDHILFLAALCAVYQLPHWRELIVLVTAFTLGHSVTLALATLDVVPVNARWVEFLIPVTIFVTAVVNVVDRRTRGSWTADRTFDRPRAAKYALALGFGLIHGMGFSTFLRAILGEEESLFMPLLGFNVGLEAGQILIAVAVLALGWLYVGGLKAPPREWTLLVSGAAGAISLQMMLQRLPFGG